tara:strand:- start:381 stop:638 length:258 start_codon:yes stop_codon:yes gene_type:complete
MFTCYLCEKETVYTCRFCPKCRSLKHQILLWGDRVFEVVDSVMCRTQDKQNNKIKLEIKKDIVKRQYNLRSSTEVVESTSEDQID